jgi:hypothetical protein
VSPTRIGIAMLLGGAASLAIVAITLFWRRRPLPGHPVERTFRRFAARLARAGLPRLAAETPRQYLRRVGARVGRDEGQLALLVESLDRLLYNPAAAGTGAELRELRRGLRRLIPKRRCASEDERQHGDRSSCHAAWASAQRPTATRHRGCATRTKCGVNSYRPDQHIAWQRRANCATATAEFVKSSTRLCSRMRILRLTPAASVLVGGRVLRRRSLIDRLEAVGLHARSASQPSRCATPSTGISAFSRRVPTATFDGRMSDRDWRGRDWRDSCAVNAGSVARRGVGAA